VPHFVPFYDRLWIADGVGIWSWDGGTSLTPHVGSTAAKRNLPPWGAQFVAKHFERLWFGGFWFKPGRLIYSNVGAASPSTVFNTVSFSTTQLFNIGRQDADDPVTAVLPQEGQVSNLLVFKRKSLWTIAGNDAATFDVDMLARVGCVGSRAATMTPGGAFWLDHDRAMWFDGVRPMNSVSNALAEHIKSRVRANPGYVWRTYLSDEFSVKSAVRHVYQASANWSAVTVGGATVLKIKQAFSTSTNMGIAYSIPCPSNFLSWRFRLPGPSAAKQRVFFRFRAPTKSDSTDRRGYVLTYGNYATTYHSAVLAAKTAVLGYYVSAGATMTKLASAAVSSAVQTGWLVCRITAGDDYIGATIHTAASGYVALAATDTHWWDPRSTMYVGVKVLQHQSTASAMMLDHFKAYFYQCNTFNQVAYSPAGNEVHFATASTDSAPQAKVLTFDLNTQDWATRDYSVACYGNYEVASARPGLGLVLKGASATDGRFRVLDRSSGYYGRLMSSYWRSQWLAGHAESAPQVLRELHTQFERRAGNRLHIFVSGSYTPWPDKAVTAKCAFAMNEAPARWILNVPGPFFRVTFCAVGSSTSAPFNVSRAAFFVHQRHSPGRWEIR
jgi:hypothetical protein